MLENYIPSPLNAMQVKMHLGRLLIMFKAVIQKRGMKKGKVLLITQKTSEV